MNAQPGVEVTVRLNGIARAVPVGTTVADLVRETLADREARAVAAARNGAIVPRAEWATTALVEGDAIEIVRPVQGG